MHQCPSCGADMRFDIEKQQLYCSHCDKTMSVEEFNKVRGAVESKESVVKDSSNDSTDEKTVENNEKTVEKEELINVTVYKCSQCGAELISDANTVATFCSYCGSPQMLTSRLAKTRKPKYVIPFKITQEEAFNKYKAKIASSLFAPKEYKKNITLDKVRGIYMPFDILNYSCDDSVSVSGEVHYRRGDYSITDFYDLDSYLIYSLEFSGHDTASNFDDTLSEAICPFDSNGKEDFKEGYLTGFYADAADKSGYTYRGIYNSAIYDYLGQKIVSSDKEYRRYAVNKEKAGRNIIASSKCERNYALCPVWFISCKHSNNRISYGVINGQTGDVAIEIPISIPKFIFASLIFAVIIFALYYFFVDFSITAKYMLIFVCILNVIGSIIGAIVSNDVRTREEEIKKCEGGVDKQEETSNIPEGGVSYSKHRNPSDFLFILVFCFFGVLMLFYGINFGEVMVAITGGIFTGISSLILLAPILQDFKMPDMNKKEVVMSLIRNVLPVIITILVIIFEKYRDNVFYLTAIYVIINVTFIFMHNIKLYNRLTTRKLPQFNKRGGE